MYQNTVYVFCVTSCVLHYRIGIHIKFRELSDVIMKDVGGTCTAHKYLYCSLEERNTTDRLPAFDANYWIRMI